MIKKKKWGKLVMQQYIMDACGDSAFYVSFLFFPFSIIKNFSVSCQTTTYTIVGEREREREREDIKVHKYIRYMFNKKRGP